MTLVANSINKYWRRKNARVKPYEKIYKRIKKQSRKFRKYLIDNKTPAENKLISIFDSLHIKYEFQKAFGFCSLPHNRFVDFYLPDFSVAIELDGRGHFTPEGRVADTERTEQFSKEHPSVYFMRFKNSEIYERPFVDIILKEFYTPPASKFKNGR